MKLFARLLVIAVLIAPLTLSPLAAQVTAPGIWPEKPLTPQQKGLRDAVIVVRDTVRSVRATVERMSRAENAGSSAVLASAARTLAADCERSARGAANIQRQVAGLSTSAARGDTVLDRFRRAALMLQQEMTACNEKATGALSPVVDTEKLGAVRATALKAVVEYERVVHELMRTLSIPLDPKGHKSAISDG